MFTTKKAIGDDWEFDLYNGRNVAAKRSVIIVEANYRLGALGFLAHPLLAAESPVNNTGMYAMLDQQFALHWVRKNIQQFGGDASNVAIYGVLQSCVPIHGFGCHCVCLCIVSVVSIYVSVGLCVRLCAYMYVRLCVCVCILVCVCTFFIRLMDVYRTAMRMFVGVNRGGDG